MTHALTQRPGVVAGLVHALCACCEEARSLVSHAELDATRLSCPETGLTYLDRGDGLYEPDGRRLEDTPTGRATPAENEMLSDRPTRTGPKSRIILEKATFA